MLENRNYLVTGASSGIGLAISKLLLSQTAAVTGVSRGVETLVLGKKFTPHALDFSQLNQLEPAFKSLLKSQPEWSGLICAAGVGQFSFLEEFSFKQMQEVMNVNFMAHALLVKLMLPYLKKNKHGHIIFLGSESALQGAKNGTLYCASKFALRGFAQSLRDECSKSGINVTLINPGMVNTPFFDRLDFAPGSAPENYIEPEDVADVVRLILSARPGTNLDEINLNPLKHVIDFKKN